MEFYLFQKLFFRNDTFFHTTNLVTNNIICYWTNYDVVIVCLISSSVFTVIQDKSGPIKGVSFKMKGVYLLQCIIVEKKLIYSCLTFTELLEFAFCLSARHLPVRC